MTPDPSLAALSDTLFSVSVAVYSLAVVAFCAQLAFGRRPARELVAAGGAPAPRTGADDISSDVRSPDAPADVPADGTAGEPGAARRWGLLALALTVLGAVGHAGVLVARGLAADRLPWGNMYEFATAVVLVGVAVYVVLAVRTPGLRHIGLFVLAPVVVAMVLVGLFLYADAGPLVAALRSSWLAVHVSTAILGFGIFFVSGIASGLYLLRSRPEEPRPGSLVSRLPGAAALDRVAHRTAVFGFPIWTFAVIAGAIWAESAWGRFWGWDPKETWAFIAWVVYAAYLHARTTAGWRGRPAAWVNLVGLGVMVFNLLYVNLVSTGLHSYGGVS
ncbi:c-type cytochrome biogenesis protein CcsB [Geodermatophilus sp. YIM 151500]|uniref:c-type cytochrome biogenesis protein CcsB n=1 Tax=Geodermatophilus sp. YIM 151500 TaxID=2984531 RepID=UPI0021E40B9E|nr:c-type cytochrome biogenesis protein CcsB [Geodermatophilus sp. YIM 151500]MCV2490424.1 c-type cytochrome biogenesis protein CcsB [Geodermatophilus sp. YIM 151500]